MRDAIEQAELFSPQGGAQTDETPPPIAEYAPLPPEERERPWLTEERLLPRSSSATRSVRSGNATACIWWRRKWSLRVSFRKTPQSR